MEKVPEGFILVEVLGVRVELPSNQPVILLRAVGGTAHLPIWIGATEAAAIAMVQQGVRPERPMTHDLFADTLRSLGADLRDVRVVELVSGVYHAELTFPRVAVSARPSDAVALALRVPVPVLVSQEVMDQAGVEISDDPEEEVDRFREFLDSVEPEDFQ